ncbi:MAG: T9SS type A sorting domain-containing protein [Crocinitomicaceae bacterium]|nr:T9SS type A sorting domain-containing protein [Crocinitomicaceae bacterium]
MKYTFFVLSLISFVNGYSQLYHFNAIDSIEVLESSTPLSFPWASGINSGQVSTIELNNDGLVDLFVFDRTDNSVLTFLNTGTAGSPNYVHAPEFEEKFPSEMRSWCLLRDYNCDGKKDIWCYATGGIAVYKNISTGGNLEFELTTNLVMSYYNTSYLNLYVSSVDIPSIDDIDGDGDLDVVTFSIFGTNLEYHRNLSMENHFTCDSLEFQIRNNCWGHFSESFTTSALQLLDTCDNSNLGVAAEYIPDQTSLEHKSAPRHSGSTVLTIDENGDGVKDVLIGDVSYPKMSMLINGGTIPNNNSSMILQDTTFPSYDNPINLKIFPAAFYEDVTNDGNRDLIVGTNTANQSADKNSMHYYLNTGTDINPTFSFQQDNLLQGEMIDVGTGSIPTFFDHNSDGLMDILLSNFGTFNASSDSYEPSISLYENMGSSIQPIYSLITDDYMNLSSSGIEKNMIPTFADVDGDGDEDMIIGDYNGVLHFFTNNAGAGNTANFVLTAPQLTDIDGITIDVGLHAAPTFVDLDEDGDFDLVIGERNGNLNYYESKSSVAPSFTLVTDSLGFVRVNYAGTSIGMSIPRFFDNANGATQLFVGSTHGEIEHFNNIDGNLSGYFNQVTNQVSNISVGLHSAPAITDVNGDNYPDLLIGNKRGGLQIFIGDSSITSVSDNFKSIDFELFPNPARETMYIRLSQSAGFSYQLFDVAGKVIISGTKTASHIHSINTQHLNPGIYFIQIFNQQGRGTRPIIVE